MVSTFVLTIFNFCMKTLTVPINDYDFANLGINTETITFNELKEKLSTEYAKAAFLKCNEIASKTELSDMSLEVINAEIAAVRNAKNSN
jgi:hypothetical protein